MHLIQIIGTYCSGDLLLAADSGQVSGLCLLDLTTVDHNLLMLRLSVSFLFAVSFSGGLVHICLTGP